MSCCRRLAWRALALLLIASAAAPTSLRAEVVDPALVAKAKAEGSVVFYTNLIVDQVVRPLATAFETGYGIKVAFTRADSQATILKLSNEARAGRTLADVWNLSSGFKELKDSHAIVAFSVPSSAAYPPGYKDKSGYWVATNIYVNTPGYNTDLVPKGTEPKTFTDLLDPKWKGKLVWKPNDISGATGFIGNVLTSMGEAQGMEYLRRLSAQNITLVDASARAILDRVIAGEYPIALQIFNTHAVISAKQGAPVDWVAMQPVTLTLQLIGQTSNAPHPNAALLFIDFMLSGAGQKIFQSAGYLPAGPDYPASVSGLKPDDGGFTATKLDPEDIDANLNHWDEVFHQLFRNGK